MIANRTQKISNDVDNSLPSYKLKSFPLTKNLPFNSFNLPFHFNRFFQPGIYAIVNTKTNKYSIVEASHLADRLSHHIGQLNVKKHDCHQLQKDCQVYGEKVFDFVIL